MKILVVDDDPASRLVAESMLQKFGHTVRAVQDGKQALACLAEEPFDVVLMDVQMPGMDGIEATKSIRKVDLRCRSGRLPVIAVPSFVGVGDRERFLAAGMDGYVSKPVSMDSLADAIARIAMPD